MAVRKKAIGALSRIADLRAIDALVGSLADPNEEVRQAAASGLGEMGDARVLPRLEDVADKDASPDVRAAAVQAVERIRLRAKRP